MNYHTLLLNERKSFNPNVCDLLEGNSGSIPPYLPHISSFQRKPPGTECPLIEILKLEFCCDSQVQDPVLYVRPGPSAGEWQMRRVGVAVAVRHRIGAAIEVHTRCIRDLDDLQSAYKVIKSISGH